MMASNILSRFLPPALGTPSVYETLRQQDESSDQSDVEERAGMAIDEENLGGRFQDHEQEEGLFDAVASQATEATFRTSVGNPRDTSRRAGQMSKRLQKSTRRDEMDEMDDEVPQSLLVEGDQDVPMDKLHQVIRPPPVTGPTTRETRAKWQVTQEQQQLHQDMNFTRRQHGNPPRQGLPLASLDPKEMAMWRWANVENLDNFLKDVYDYFLGNGFWCILLCRLLNLL